MTAYLFKINELNKLNECVFFNKDNRNKKQLFLKRLSYVVRVVFKNKQQAGHATWDRLRREIKTKFETKLKENFCSILIQIFVQFLGRSPIHTTRSYLPQPLLS